MFKKIVLLFALMPLIAVSDKKHIIINDHYQKDVSKDFLKIILPPLAGISFLNYAINPKAILSPVALLRGANAFLFGALNLKKGYHYYDNEDLLRIEAGIIGGALVTASALKALESLDNHVLQPTLRTAKKTYSFVKNHALFCGLAIASGVGLYYYHNGIKNGLLSY